MAFFTRDQHCPLLAALSYGGVVDRTKMSIISTALEGSKHAKPLSALKTCSMAPLVSTEAHTDQRARRNARHPKFLFTIHQNRTPGQSAATSLPKRAACDVLIVITGTRQYARHRAVLKHASTTSQELLDYDPMQDRQERVRQLPSARCRR